LLEEQTRLCGNVFEQTKAALDSWSIAITNGIAAGIDRPPQRLGFLARPLNRPLGV